MGAWFSEEVAAGRTPNEAYNRALASAEAEYGHQEGYSGAINSKATGFTLVDLPPRFSTRKLISLLSDYEDVEALVADAKDKVRANSPGGYDFARRGVKGRLAKAQSDLRRAQAKYDRLLKGVPPTLAARVEGLSQQMTEKWEVPLAVEVKPSEAKKMYPRTYESKRRGEKIYLFFGYAPS